MQPISGECGEVGEYESIPEQLESSEQVRGHLFINPGVESDSYDVPGFIEFSRGEWSSGRSEMVVSDGDQNQGAIYIEAEDGPEPISVLSEPVHYAVAQVRRSNIEDAISLSQDNSRYTCSRVPST